MTTDQPKPRKLKSFNPTKLLSETKIHGGKSYLCRRIFQHAPVGYSHFADLYGGAGSMIYNAPTHLQVKVFTDTNLFRVSAKMAIKKDPNELQDQLRKLKYDKETWKKYKAINELHKTIDKRGETIPHVEAAVAYIVTNRMSRGGLGKAFGWSERLRGGQPGDLNAWESMVDRIPDLSQSLQNTSIYRYKALSVFDSIVSVKKADKRLWFVYLDPPYFPDTRSAKTAYDEDDMTAEQHEELLKKINNETDIRIAISGYINPTYDKYLKDWRRIEFNMPNHSGQGKNKQRRIEALWMNYAP